MWIYNNTVETTAFNKLLTVTAFVVYYSQLVLLQIDNMITPPHFQGIELSRSTT